LNTVGKSKSVTHVESEDKQNNKQTLKLDILIRDPSF